MSTYVIVSIIANVILMIALIYVSFGKKLYMYIGDRKKQRETQRKQEIRKIVIEYLEEIRNDG